MGKYFSFGIISKKNRQGYDGYQSIQIFNQEVQQISLGGVIHFRMCRGWKTNIPILLWLFGEIWY